MNILLCHDGSTEADAVVRFAAVLLSRASRVKLTLFGVASGPEDEPRLRDALEISRRTLYDLSGLWAVVQIRAGEPIREILVHSLLGDYDLVIIGARRKAGTGEHWRSARVYEIIKSVLQPVLVVAGSHDRLRRVLVCASGRPHVGRNADLVAHLAAPFGANATLLHVLPETESIDPARDAAEFLEGDSGLARNLRAHRDRLTAAGLPTEIHLRRGAAFDELAREIRAGDCDLVVTGTLEARGRVRQHILNDITREVVNRSRCPVLIVRQSAADRDGEAKTGESKGVVASLQRLFRLSPPRRPMGPGTAVRLD